MDDQGRARNQLMAIKKKQGAKHNEKKKLTELLV